MTNEKVKTKEASINSHIPELEIIPDMDIYLKDDEFYLEGNMPGVDETSLDISFEKNTLTILGKNNTPRLDNFTLRYAEYRNANYRRSFQFQENIDIDGIEAVIKNGVLKLKVPVKKPETKKITVKTN
ncbi:MAG: Hsp20/alpha crystallin family protein [Spirochaetia bacterium]|nr:Hsp20/alpha crystallin family protein [Spirochaetia bacterium]